MPLSIAKKKKKCGTKPLVVLDLGKGGFLARIPGGEETVQWCKGVAPRPCIDQPVFPLFTCRGRSSALGEQLPLRVWGQP